jgi:predicted nuclease of restriction endonuclease-like RecB superfamily
MKKITLSLMTLLFAFQLTAQSTEKTYFLMNESRVLDTDIYKKNYPAIRNWWVAATKGITYNFAAHTSESGRTYSMVFVKGEENLGKYVGSRSSLSERAASDLKSITAENTANRSQAIQRSVWVQATNISVMVPDFKVENYDFRKVVLFTVPFDKVAEYDKLIEQTIAEDKALGISYNYIMYKAVDGYPNNTYMMILPDKSRLQYYTHQEERNAKRKGQTKMAELNKKASQLRTTIRLDHLSRVAGQ